MKKSSFFSLGIVFFLTYGLAYVSSFLGENKSLDRNSGDGPGFLLAGKKAEDGQNLNYFEKGEKDTAYDLTYGWKDYEKNDHYISFSISKQQLKEADIEFGYVEDELEKNLAELDEKMRKEMIAHLKKFIAGLIVKSTYQEYIFIEDIDALNFRLKLSSPPPFYEKVKAAFESIKTRMADEQNLYLKKIEKEVENKKREYLEQRGFRLISDKISVNYGLCVENNRPRVKHVLEIMTKIDRKASLHRFLGLMLAFIQEIRYGLPPLRENNKLILEFYVPPKVLVNNLGDCDSKGVAFASLWTNFKKYPLILIKIPKHLFIGLAIPSMGEEGIIVNGLRYTLCEVTGPEKMPPGLITQYSALYLQGGKFRYEMIK